MPSPTRIEEEKLSDVPFYIYVATSENNFIVYQEKLQKIWQCKLGGDEQITSVAFLDDARQFLIGTQAGTVQIHDLVLKGSTGQKIVRFHLLNLNRALIHQ